MEAPVDTSLYKSSLGTSMNPFLSKSIIIYDYRDALLILCLSAYVIFLVWIGKDFLYKFFV